MKTTGRKFNSTGFIILLVICALLLLYRVVYIYISEPGRFPVNTVKISASFEHISRADIEKVLDDYYKTSFILLSLNNLQADLSTLNWAKSVKINRIWPDTLKITIVEKKPVAIWKSSFVTEDGSTISASTHDIEKQNLVKTLPALFGPDSQQEEVLQSFLKLNKILTMYSLRADSINLHENQSWDLYLSDGVVLRLGKKDIENRVLRFCKAYSAMFADKSEKLVSVDLRYPHGMAVQWNATK